MGGIVQGDHGHQPVRGDLGKDVIHGLDASVRPSGKPAG
jgi:hypothetical protein